MPLDEGIALMKKGVKEINERFLVGGATFTLKVSEYPCCQQFPVQNARSMNGCKQRRHGVVRLWLTRDWAGCHKGWSAHH